MNSILRTWEKDFPLPTPQEKGVIPENWSGSCAVAAIGDAVTAQLKKEYPDRDFKVDRYAFTHQAAGTGILCENGARPDLVGRLVNVAGIPLKGNVPRAEGVPLNPDRPVYAQGIRFETFRAFPFQPTAANHDGTMYREHMSQCLEKGSVIGCLRLQKHWSTPRANGEPYVPFPGNDHYMTQQLSNGTEVQVGHCVAIYGCNCPNGEVKSLTLFCQDNMHGAPGRQNISPDALDFYLVPITNGFTITEQSLPVHELLEEFRVTRAAQESTLFFKLWNKVKTFDLFSAPALPNKDYTIYAPAIKETIPPHITCKCVVEAAQNKGFKENGIRTTVVVLPLADTTHHLEKRVDGHFTYGLASSPEKRASMEDFYEARADAIDGETVGLFGVFDGHWGARAAEYVKQHLFSNLIKHPMFMADTKAAIGETYSHTDSEFLKADSSQTRDGRFTYGFTSSPGKRASMEDFYEARADTIDGETVGLFGVFDGHGGARAAEYVKRHLFSNLIKHPMFMADTQAAIAETYSHTDSEFLKADSSQTRDGRFTYGLTSSPGKRASMEDFYEARAETIDGETVGLFGVFDGHGGARAAEYVKRRLFSNLIKHTKFITDTKAAIGMRISTMMDQIHARRESDRSDERQRIEDAVGFVMWAGTWRVGGVLAVSRAFGAKLLKQYVVADPDIKVKELLVSVDELLDTDEVICTGTAVVVPPLANITYL